MTTLEMLIDVLSRSRERFDRAFDGVTLEQANTRPAPDARSTSRSRPWRASSPSGSPAATASTSPCPCPTTPRTGATHPSRPPRSSSATSASSSPTSTTPTPWPPPTCDPSPRSRSMTSLMSPGTRPSPGPCAWPQSLTTPPSTPARPSTPGASWACRARPTTHPAPHVRPDLAVQGGANGSHMTRVCWGPRGPVVREDQAAGSTASPRRSTVTGRSSASVTTTSAHRPARSAPTDESPRTWAPWTLAA